MSQLPKKVRVHMTRRAGAQASGNTEDVPAPAPIQEPTAVMFNLAAPITTEVLANDDSSLYIPADRNLIPAATNVDLTEEEQRYYDAITQFSSGTINWKRVSEHLGGGRTPEQCRQFWRVVLKPKLEGKKLTPWTEEEDELLKEAVQRHGHQGKNGAVNWDMVAMFMGSTRSTQQCCMRWHSKLKTQIGDFKIGEWSMDELKLLKESVEMYSGKGRGGKINWTKVEQRFGGTRSAKQCCNRWKNNGKPFGYPPEESVPEKKPKPAVELSPEDYLFIEAVEKHSNGHEGRGAVNFDLVAQALDGTRTAQQCRLYWQQTLKPKLDRTNFEPWTPEEDALLEEGVGMYSGMMQKGGVAWNRVSEHMGGSRLPKHCQHRWYNIVKPRLDGVRVGEWSAEEDALMMEGVEMYLGHGKNGAISWQKVSEHMGFKRSHRQCRDHWVKLHRDKNKPRKRKAKELQEQDTPAANDETTAAPRVLDAIVLTLDKEAMV